MMNLLLFDIDGTLVARSTGHDEAFAVAFKEVYGVYGSMHMIQYHGKTDQAIIRDALLKCGITESVINSGMEDCMKVMSNYFDAIKTAVKSEELPTVSETLQRLDAEGNLLGLVTGNLESIAYAKLASAGIRQHFKLGGFGSSSAERSELIKIAINTATRRFGFTDAGAAFYFGDTPQDMQAADKGGAVAIGVSTGAYSADELYAAGANKVAKGFAECEEILSYFQTGT